MNNVNKGALTRREAIGKPKAREDSLLQQLFRPKSIDAILKQQSQVQEISHHGKSLKRTLGVMDLTLLGVAAILGAGVFSTIGKASFEGGPGVSLLFIFTAIACSFCALCYAEFAAKLPIAGSAYTYAYASFGELAAWIVGWNLLMEYSIANIAVAISWSGYLVGFLAAFGIHLPDFFTCDYMSAHVTFNQVTELLGGANSLSDLVANHTVTQKMLHEYMAWANAPRVFGVPMIFNLPALLITLTITAVVYIGIEESRLLSNVLVAFKLMLVLLVIAIGAAYVNPENWHPFLPNGESGVLKGVAAVFFAYIGFDAISTTAEECKDPQRDLPRGMIASLLICTCLYIAVALVLTGVVRHSQLGVPDPLAYIFGPDGIDMHWVYLLLSFGGVVALCTVLLVYQLGQPRIWMAMSRDGLLPPIFSAIHPKYRTPWFSTLLTGFVVAIPSLFMSLSEVTDLASIGTLFAFSLVCAGIMFQPVEAAKQGAFKVPYVNARYVFPFLLATALGYFFLSFYPELYAAGSLQEPGLGHLSFILRLAEHHVLETIYLLGMVALAYACFIRSLSLIPALGLASCTYLMSQLGAINWVRFGCWFFLGIVVYFTFSIKHSHARVKTAPR